MLSIIFLSFKSVYVVNYGQWYSLQIAFFYLSFRQVLLVWSIVEGFPRRLLPKLGLQVSSQTYAQYVKVRNVTFIVFV